MPNYRRIRVSGGTYFFTVNLADHSSYLLVSNIEALRTAVATTKIKSPFHIDAWVVLPNHMHCLWTLPPDDGDFAARWRAIKKAFSKSVEPAEHRSPVRQQRHERGVWQRRFWEHTVRDERDYAAHMDYIHFNPVKYGFAKTVAEWPFSSFRRCVARGLYPEDWIGADQKGDGWGEPR